MSSPSDHQPSVPQPSLPPPPAPAPARSQPTTQEIPVVPPGGGQLPPHPGATAPPPVQPVAEAAPGPQPTGPVDFVPGPPTTPPPPPQVAEAPGASAAGSDTTSVWPHSLDDDPDRTATTTVARPPRDRAGLISAGLVVLALVLLQLGLGLRFGGESFWSELPLWSAFATACTVLGLAGSTALPGASRLGAGTGWRIAVGGLVGLAVFWVLVVLPVVAGDRGFLLTAALGCLGAALWTGPARRR
ncbi:hypothetical protein [Blastococcus sp. TF02A-30]|uniref:hypothetical protein n=1 Tax=Blastococcus sp. TF02A-30 TaxID=2250580 RepID=UPI000DEBB8AC|nr:hypothetical protein [Blastococcus sp. TF02A-30]RBY92598.1 hypothetical protein DQ241_00455 [Blastococcus sp. TF02A-30]